VWLEIEGPAAELDRFVANLEQATPTHARGSIELAQPQDLDRTGP